MTTTDDAKVLDIEEFLSAAKRPETVARLFLRADLLGTRTRILHELGVLIERDGTVITEGLTEDEVPGRQAHAQELADELRQVDRELAGSVRYVRFRGLSSQAWDVFLDRYLPEKADDSQLGEFNMRLVAETAIEPKMNFADVQQLCDLLGSAQVAELFKQAMEACTQGGVGSPPQAVVPRIKAPA